MSERWELGGDRLRVVERLPHRGRMENFAMLARAPRDRKIRDTSWQDTRAVTVEPENRKREVKGALL